MKYNILFIMLLLSSYVSFGQRGYDVWIPKVYIDIISETGSRKESENLLKPIESIVFKNKVYYIQTYRGLSQPIMNKLPVSGKIALNALSFNLKYFTQKEQDSINKYNFFLNIFNDSIILEARKGTVLHSIKFIKEIKGYNFESVPTTTVKLLLVGKYDLYDCEELNLQTNINLLANGTVLGSTDFLTYQIAKVFVPDNKNTFYDLLNFSTLDGSTRKFAFYYDEQQLCWFAYDYKTSYDKYTIIPSEKYVFKLKKTDR